MLHGQTIDVGQPPDYERQRPKNYDLAHTRSFQFDFPARSRLPEEIPQIAFSRQFQINLFGHRDP
jgi:hypothetical protein